MIKIESKVVADYRGSRYVRIDWDDRILVRWIGRATPVKHARTKDSTVYFHPSGLWVRAGKNWLERIDQ